MIQPVSSSSPFTASTYAMDSMRERKHRAKFGSAMAPDLTDKQLSAFQAAIEKSCPEIGKYGTIDMKGGYGRLSFVMKSFVNKAAQQLSPNKIREYAQRKLFGVMEEAGDAMFELWTLRILQRGWIKDWQVQRWADIVQAGKKDNRPFGDVLRDIQSELPKDVVEDFQKMTSLQPERAKTMLGLIGCKFALFKAEQPDFDMLGNTRPLLVAETEELFETKPKWSPVRNVALGISHLYTALPFLPVKLFDSLLVSYMKHRLELPIKYDEVSQYPLYKHVNRQYTHYNWQNEDKSPQELYQARKASFKPFEVVLEAGMLHKAEAEKAGTQA